MNYKEETKQQNWDIIESKSFKDIANRLEKYKNELGVDVKNVLIRHHGSSPDGTLAVRENGSYSYAINKDVVNNYLKTGNSTNSVVNNYLEGFIAIAKLMVPNSNMIFGACNAGGDEGLGISMSKLLEKNGVNNLNLFYSKGLVTFMSNREIFIQKPTIITYFTEFNSTLNSSKTYKSDWVQINWGGAYIIHKKPLFINGTKGKQPIEFKKNKYFGIF